MRLWLRWKHVKIIEIQVIKRQLKVIQGWFLDYANYSKKIIQIS